MGGDGNRSWSRWVSQSITEDQIFINSDRWASPPESFAVATIKWWSAYNKALDSQRTGDWPLSCTHTNSTAESVSVSVCLSLFVHTSPFGSHVSLRPPFSTSPAGLLLSIDGAMKRVYLPLVIYLLPNSVHFDSIRIEPFERLLCNLLVKYCQKLRLFLQMHWEKWQ